MSGLYEILTPDENDQKYYIVPRFYSGQCWEAENLHHAQQILRFANRGKFDAIDSVTKLDGAT